MTSAEMHAALVLELQQIGSFVYDDFQPEEIDHYLNKAQEDFIRVRASQFESNNIVRGELRSVVKEFVLLPAIPGDTFLTGNQYEYLIPYPEDFWFLIKAEVGITRTGTPLIEEKTYVPSVDIRNDQLDKVRVTPFHKPYLRYPAMSQMEDFMHVFVDHETSLEDMKVRYVRSPVLITWHPDNTEEENFDCELPDVTHDMIVEMAVALMKRDIPARSNPPVQIAQPQ